MAVIRLDDRANIKIHSAIRADSNVIDPVYPTRNAAACPALKGYVDAGALRRDRRLPGENGPHLKAKVGYARHIEVVLVDFLTGHRVAAYRLGPASARVLHSVGLAGSIVTDLGRLHFQKLRLPAGL